MYARSSYNQRSRFRQPVDIRAMLIVDGHHLDARIIDLSEAGYRVRVPRALRHDAPAYISFARADGGMLTLHGRVATRYPDEGAEQVYGVSFFANPRSTLDALAHEVYVYQRREGRRRSAERSGEVVERSQRRGAYRVGAEFAVAIEGTSRGIQVGRALDVSANGLRLVTSEPLKVGDRMDIVFRLPDVGRSIVRRTPAQEITPFGIRSRRSTPSEGFARLRLPVRVVRDFGARDGAPTYALAFEAEAAYARDEIARFVHFAQLEERAVERGQLEREGLA